MAMARRGSRGGYPTGPVDVEAMRRRMFRILFRLPLDPAPPAVG